MLSKKLKRKIFLTKKVLTALLKKQVTNRKKGKNEQHKTLKKQNKFLNELILKKTEEQEKKSDVLSLSLLFN